jgi:hypothetical protein
VWNGKEKFLATVARVRLLLGEIQAKTSMQSVQLAAGIRWYKKVIVSPVLYSERY